MLSRCSSSDKSKVMGRLSWIFLLLGYGAGLIKRTNTLIQIIMVLSLTLLSVLTHYLSLKYDESRNRLFNNKKSTVLFWVGSILSVLTLVVLTHQW